MLDLAGYPHIREQIISCLDRPTLASFARTSRSSHRAVTPYLYPSTLFDPLYTSCAARLMPRIYRQDGRDIPTSLPEAPSAERATRKLISLLSSPHLKRARTVIIDHPQQWSRDLLQLREKILPAERGENTVTIIRVEPLVSHRAIGGWQRASAMGTREAVPSARMLGKAYYHHGLKPDLSLENYIRLPSHKVSSSHVVPTDYTHFIHLFDIASLIPSAHLVLYIPYNRLVNLDALISAACDAYGPPSTAVRRLTILVESGNAYHFDSSRVPPPGHSSQHTWLDVELVFLPNPSGDVSIIYMPPPPRSPWATTLYPNPSLASDEGSALKLIGSPLDNMVRGRKWPKSYTVVGVEGMEATLGDLEAFKEKALSACMRRLARFGTAATVAIRLATLEKWELGASFLADCVALGVRRG